MAYDIVYPQLTGRSLELQQLLVDVRLQDSLITQYNGETANFRKLAIAEASRAAIKAGSITPTNPTPTPGAGTYSINGIVLNGGIGDGDSLTSGGSAGNTVSWLEYFAQKTGKPMQNVAVSGDLLNYMKDNYFGNDNPGPRYNAQTCNVNFLLAGTNDIALDDRDVPSMQVFFQTYAQKVKDATYPIFVVGTIPQRALNSPNWNQAKEDKRKAVNAYLLSTNWPLLTVVVNLENVIQLSDLADGGASTGLHWNNTGAEKVANAFLAAFTYSAGGVVVTPAPVDTSAGILAADGTVDMAKWEAMAKKMGTAEGIAYRYGPNAPTQPANTPQLWTPQTQYMPGGDVRSYQFGQYSNESGDFASNIEHIAYIPDDPSKQIGGAAIQGSSIGHSVVSVLPELSWVIYQPNNLDARELLHWKTRGYPNLSQPVACAHALARPGWAVGTAFGFADGTIAWAGANTMTNKCIVRLAEGKKITGMAISSSNEMLVCSIWDIINKRGELAFISLTGLGEGASIANQDPDAARGAGFEGWWGEWRTAHPGMHNLGNIVYAKVLGYFPLGDDMKAPTEVSFTTGHNRFYYLNGSGQFNAQTGDGTTGNTGNWTASEEQRRLWMPGGMFSNRYAKQGMVIVGSKSEKRVKWVDVSSLFTFINSYYFNTDRNKYLETTNIGDGSNQWPYTFARNPEQMPAVVKTVTFASEVNAVLIYPYSTQDKYRQSWVVTADGKLRTFALGGYPHAGGNPAGIVQVGEMDLGPNVTSLYPCKEKARGTQTQVMGDPSRMLIACVRGQAKIKWVSMGDTNGTIVLEAQDPRIIDPISAEDMDNHGTEQYVAAVGDFKGRGTHNVLWGPMILWTYAQQRHDLGATGTDKVAYAGKFSTPGPVFAVRTANIS